MKIVLFLFVVHLLGIIQTGHSLKCYKCNGCESMKSQVETCKEVDPNTQQSACLTQTVRDARIRDVMTIKKCTVIDKNVPYKCISLPDSDEMSCNTCLNDYCNNSKSIHLNHSLSIGLLLLLYISRSLFNFV